MHLNHWTTTTLTLGMIAGASVLGFRHYAPPQIVPATAAAGHFSAERASRHLKKITIEPHPVGSEGNRRVREYLLQSIKQLGLDGQVQTATGISTIDGLNAATVHNVMARKPGSRSSRAILLVAHYDAVPHSFGAGDDGAGVAAILETVRALNTQPVLTNDLIVLFTDGEEQGMLGAEAFTGHPWMEDVGLVLNFEGRGSNGPVFMFETSRQNGILIEELSRVAPKPVTNSLTYEVYKLLPNYTDFTVFNSMKDPPPGYNFSFIHQHAHYHTPLDNFDQVDLRSVQHHGSYMLSLVRHFGDQDLTNLKALDRIFFAFPGLGLIHYSGLAGYLFSGLSVLLFGGLVYLAFSRNLINARGLFFGSMSLMVILLVGPTLIFACWQGIILLFPQYALVQHGAPYNAIYYLVAFCALSGLIAIGVVFAFRHRTSALEFTVASLMVWVLLGLLTTFFLAGASFLFVWPSLAVIVALTLSILLEEGLLRLLMVTGLVGLAVALFSPIIWLLQVALTIQLIPVSIVLAVLLICIAYLPISWVMDANRMLLPTSLSLVCLSGLIGGSLTAGYNSDRKQGTQMLFVIDADLKEANWVSYYSDPWTRQFLGSNPAKGDLSHLKFFRNPFYAPVSPGQYSVPLVDFRDTVVGTVREIEVYIVTQEKVRNLMFHLEDQSVSIRQLAINGTPVPEQAYGPSGIRTYGAGNFLRFFGVANGFTKLTLSVDSGQRLVLRLIALIPGLPEVDSDERILPQDLMPKRFSHYTLIEKNYEL